MFVECVNGSGNKLAVNLSGVLAVRENSKNPLACWVCIAGEWVGVELPYDAVMVEVKRSCCAVQGRRQDKASIA